MQTEKRILIGIVAASFFMEGLDATIINTSLPQIAFSLHIDPIRLKVALTSYLIAAGILIPVSGWLADRFGARRIYQTAIFIFLLGSLLCGFSHNLPELVIARIIQGIGGALSLPVGRLLFMRNFSRSEFAEAASITATFGLLGPTCGPVFGGILTTYCTWRAIFFVNIPIGLVGAYFIYHYVQNLTDENRKPFDWYGFLLLSCALSLIVFSLDIIINPLFSQSFSFLVLGTGCLLLMCYAYYAKNAQHPLISPELFANRQFLWVTLGSLLTRLALGAMPFVLPLLFQLGLGFSSLRAGLYMMVVGISALSIKFFIKPLIQNIGYFKILVFNSFILVIALSLLSLLTLNAASGLIIIFFIVYGISASIQFSTMFTLSFQNIPNHLHSMGSSFISSFQQIMNSFGIACSAIILELFLGTRDIIHTYSAGAFRDTLLTLALLPLLGCIFFSRLSKQTN